MNVIKKFYGMSPFWEGVASAFDLFGSLDDVQTTLKKSSAKRLKKNKIQYDFSIVGRDLKNALKQYEKQIRKCE